MSVPRERTQKWTSDVGGSGEKVLSQEEQRPYQCVSLLLLYSANAQRTVPNDPFTSWLSRVKRAGLEVK